MLCQETAYQVTLIMEQLWELNDFLTYLVSIAIR